ncbi:MAG: 6,7-dimethyl-8-ribityllumazine synthase [Dehalococcoidia bacterium]|nr:6,7-dimethyl-8-ribityllumazine synthase [Dehalococcoidia bacterium]
MSPELHGSLHGQGLRFGMVVSRFNDVVTARLASGAREALRAHGVAEQDIDVVSVPGAFEIPLAAQAMAKSGRYAGVVCLGAVIRGETAHFEYVSSGAINGIARVMLDTGVPVTLGILTTDTVQQALVRAGEGGENRGAHAALAALEMANLLRTLSS